MSKPWPRWPLLLAALLTAGPSLAGGRPTPVSPSELTALRARESARSADSLAKLRAQKYGLGLNDRDDFRPSHVQTDRFGLTHTRFQQLHQGVPVWGGAAITHLDASGVALPVTAEGVLKGVRLSVHPALDAPAAVSLALLKLAGHGPPSVEPKAELIIYPRTRRVSLSPDKRLKQQNAVDFRQEVVDYKLAWHVHTELDNVRDGVVQEDFIIDAQTGWMIKKWNALETAAAVGTGHSEYSGEVPLSTYQNGSGQFELRDITRTGGEGLRTLDAHHLGTSSDPAAAVLYTDADNTWGDGFNYVAGGSTTDDNGQTAAVDAHFGLLATWDFYQRIFNRYGIDDLGTPTFNRVHIGTGYDNAYWSDSCYCMSYGDGSFSSSNPYALLTVTALDVTGHELSHGVTAQTDALIYAGESGGLNEATSDIFGTMTEFWVRGGRNSTIGDGGGNWLIGEDLNPYFPLRFMYKPSLDGASVDAWYPGIENIDVHSSSGPMNRAFYFLSAGADPTSAGSDLSSDYLPAGMTGVGNDAAAAIWYRAVTTYLYPSSNYVSARTAALQSESDLPRFSYPLTMPPSVLVNADDATFHAFAEPVAADLRRTLQDCEITDKATRRTLLTSLFCLALLDGRDDEARQLLPQVQANEDKEERRLLAWRVETAYLQAAQAAGTKTGPEFDRAFEAADRALTDALPWDVVQEGVKQEQGERKLLLANGVNLLAGTIQEQLDPVYAKTGTIDLPSARLLIRLRPVVKLEMPLWKQDAPILGAYVEAHTVTKPDIWAAREVTFAPEQKLTPVAVGIWDDGVDPQVFPNGMFEQADGSPETRHGLAFDDAGRPSASWLYPITPAQQADYPRLLELERGSRDQEENIASPDAAHFVEALSKLSPGESKETLHALEAIGQTYMHGTHVAGIAVRGNPAARVAVFRFNDWLHEMPFRPTPEYVETMRQNFAAIGRYAAANHVRVVNMSWRDNVAEFEEWLARTDANADPAARKADAQALYQIWRTGIQEAIRNAPDTLFCAAAGNSNQDAGFQEEVPASLEEPNLLTVGAVNQAGDPANFTSYGKTVVIYADGWNVPSSVPGGGSLRMSGTSMATPQVANLAAKLFALEPNLTAAEARRLILDGATPSEDSKRALLNPKRSVELLQQRVAKR